jgi:hypothetical protein
MKHAFVLYDFVLHLPTKIRIDFNCDGRSPPTQKIVSWPIYVGLWAAICTLRFYFFIF